MNPSWKTCSCLFTLAVLVWLVGCGGEATPAPTPSPTPAPTPTPTPIPPGTAAPIRIQAQERLVVGVRYDMPPFCFVTEEGDLEGFDIDLARELARRWLGNPEAVEFRQVRSDTAADHILSEDVDLTLSALLHTQGAEEQVDFGPPVFEDGQALLIRTADAVSITTPLSLAGHLVAVVAGSGASSALWATVPFTPSLVAYDNFDQALDALARGEVSAVADLRHRLVRGMNRLPGTMIVGQYSSAFLAPAYGPEQPGFANLVAFTFQDLFADGTFAGLYGRWFPGDSPPAHENWPGEVMTTLEAAGRMARQVDTIYAIQVRGRMRVAMLIDRYPFSYLDDNGTADGYEVHLARVLAERWLGDRTAVDFIPVSEVEGMRMVTNGEADMLIGALAHTREMELQADFSLTTYVGGEGIMIQAGTPLEGIASLNGQTVAVVQGSDSAEVLRQASEGARIVLTILPQPTLEEALAALAAGEAMAVVGQRVDLLGPAYLTPGVGLTAHRLTRVPIGLVLPPGDSHFRDRVNLTLQALQWDGTLPAVYWQWFDDDPPQMPPWPGEPTQPLHITLSP
ncbi:MAG: transporter substrate-binding domain-containing protein, partial [Anaerolineae bacterium]|nr:transporter substrate-binding domain-containing protein [Anaerolineae bacterium]